MCYAGVTPLKYILDFSVSLCENKSSAVIQKGENILNIDVLISPQGEKRHRTNISYDAAH